MICRMPVMSEPDHHRRDIERERERELVRRRAGYRLLVTKSRRRERSRRSPTIGAWVGTFGLVGWTVTVPTLLGLALGAFLDDRFGGQLRFTISFLLIGVVAGVATAWYWVRREIHVTDRHDTDRHV